MSWHASIFLAFHLLIVIILCKLIQDFKNLIKIIHEVKNTNISTLSLVIKGVEIRIVIIIIKYIAFKQGVKVGET
jgi:hypothetical protein